MFACARNEVHDNFAHILNKQTKKIEACWWQVQLPVCVQARKLESHALIGQLSVD